MQPLLEAIREVETRLRPTQQQWEGRVHVQLPSGLGQLLLPHLLTLQKSHPALHLTVALDDRVTELVSEGVDVALRLSAAPPDGIASRLLARIKTPLFAAADFIQIDSLSALVKQPHVRFSGIALDAPLWLVRGDETIKLAVTTVFRASSSEGLLQALQSGIGIGGMQLPLASAALKSGSIVQVLPEFRLPDRFLYVVFPDARFIPPRVRGIITLLERQLLELPGIEGI